MRSHMKIAVLLSVAAAVGLKSGALAAPYDELAAKGYRWITTDGPYACPSKDDLRQIIKHRADEAVIERLRVYYLIEGVIVQMSKRMQLRACPRFIRPKLDLMCGPLLH